VNHMRINITLAAVCVVTFSGCNRSDQAREERGAENQRRIISVEITETSPAKLKGFLAAGGLNRIFETNGNWPRQDYSWYKNIYPETKLIPGPHSDWLPFSFVAVDFPDYGLQPLSSNYVNPRLMAPALKYCRQHRVPRIKSGSHTYCQLLGIESCAPEIVGLYQRQNYAYALSSAFDYTNAADIYVDCKREALLMCGNGSNISCNAVFYGDGFMISLHSAKQWVSKIAPVIDDLKSSKINYSIGDL
jgi:hypothetical protein